MDYTRSLFVVTRFFIASLKKRPKPTILQIVSGNMTDTVTQYYQLMIINYLENKAN